MIYVKYDSTDANFNFALEKYLIEELDIASGYFLFWRTTTTLMIGRYQNALAEINMDFAKQHNIHIVRRVTGGGTIYTDLNGWQFSFINKRLGTKEIDFHTYTLPIIEALASLGVQAEKSGRNDLLIDGKKFSGNAQYIRKNVMLHHGSILFDTDLTQLVRSLSPDDEKFISKGIKSVRSRVTNVAEHLNTKLDSLGFRDVMLEFLLTDKETYELTPADVARVNEIKAAQFDSWDWNFGKTPNFNISKENRFAGGKLKVESFVKDGHIEQIKFYGDFFAKEGLEDLEDSLRGCHYDTDDIKKALLHMNAQCYFFNITLDEILSCII